MTLYNCHTDGDQYRITKFDSDGNVESTYLCTEDECECPAGVRPTCRHRQMLPKFIARSAVNTFWFFDFDRGGWVTNETSPKGLDDEPELEPRSGLLGGLSEHPLPNGVEAFSLGDPATLHNALADALGEPEAKLEPHSPTATTTAFDAVDSGSIPLVAAKAPKIVRRI